MFPYLSSRIAKVSGLLSTSRGFLDGSKDLRFEYSTPGKFQGYKISLFVLSSIYNNTRKYTYKRCILFQKIKVFQQNLLNYFLKDDSAYYFAASNICNPSGSFGSILTNLSAMVKAVALSCEL